MLNFARTYRKLLRVPFARFNSDQQPGSEDPNAPAPEEVITDEQRGRRRINLADFESASGPTLSSFLNLESAEPSKTQTQAKDADARKFRQCCDMIALGETEKAFLELIPLAESGHAGAQVYVGFLYKIWKHDFQSAYKYFKLAADQDHSGGLYQLGLYYKFVQPDPEKSMEYLVRASDLRHPKALYLVGLSYETGDGVPRDMGMALDAFFKSASYGCQFSQYALGLFYLYGIEDCELITKDAKKGINFIQLSANQGYAPAQFTLGHCYFDGLGVEEDRAEAVRHFQLSSDQGNLHARFSLGQCHEFGKGTPRDQAKAYEIYLKCGTSKANNRLGVLHYYKSPDIEHSIEKAIGFFKLALETGSILASHNLGNCYYYSRAQKDVALALQYYLKAADTGNFPSSCQCVARIYRAGALGVPQNFQLAEKYYKLALEKIRDPVGRNLVELGDLYNFMMSDYEKARETYEKAAEKGNDTALFNLGNIYLYGKGTVSDTTHAYSLFVQAADKGHIMACMVVSKAYLSGIGMATDIAKAVQYLEVAAKSSSEAQLRLGLLYVKGPKSIFDAEKGVANLEKSAAQRNSKACFELAKIYYDALYNTTQNLEKAKFYYDRADENGKFAYFKNKSFDLLFNKPTETSTTKE